MIMRNYCTLLLSLPLALAIHAAPLDSSRLVQDARAQIGVTTGYDGSYRNLAYPLGKVAMRAEKDGFILSTNIYLAATHRLAIMSTDPKRNELYRFAVLPKLWVVERSFS